MLFINISWDYISIFGDEVEYNFENKNLERVLPQVLKDIYEKKFFDKIYVLNWPWSFTSLRVGSLCLNTLNFLYPGKIDFFDISKIDFFKYFVDKNFLPNIWVLYIWQKKNFWKYDFDLQNYEQVGLDDIKNFSSKYFVEKMNFVWEQEFPADIIFQDWLIWIKYCWKEFLIKLNEISFKKVNIIEPNYMILPNIS